MENTKLILRVHDVLHAV